MNNWIKTTGFSTFVTLLFNSTFRREVARLWDVVKRGVMFATDWVKVRVSILYYRIFRPKELQEFFAALAVTFIIAKILTDIGKNTSKQAEPNAA